MVIENIEIENLRSIKKKRLLHSVIYLREKFIKDSRSYDKIILISNFKWFFGIGSRRYNS